MRRAASEDARSTCTSTAPPASRWNVPAWRTTPASWARRQCSCAGSTSASSARTSSANGTAVAHAPLRGAHERARERLGVVVEAVGGDDLGRDDAHAELGQPRAGRTRPGSCRSTIARRGTITLSIDARADVLVQPLDVVGGAVADRLARLLQQVADVDAQAARLEHRAPEPGHEQRRQRRGEQRARARARSGRRAPPPPAPAGWRRRRPGSGRGAARRGGRAPPRSRRRRSGRPPSRPGARRDASSPARRCPRPRARGPTSATAASNEPTTSVSAARKMLPKAWPASSPRSKRCRKSRFMSDSSSASAIRQLRMSPGGGIASSRRRRPLEPPSSVSVTIAVICAPVSLSPRSSVERPVPPPRQTMRSWRRGLTPSPRARAAAA